MGQGRNAMSEGWTYRPLHWQTPCQVCAAAVGTVAVYERRVWQCTLCAACAEAHRAVHGEQLELFTKKGISMAKFFRDLRARMSPEAQETAAKKAQAMLADMPTDFIVSEQTGYQSVPDVFAVGTSPAADMARQSPRPDTSGPG